MEARARLWKSNRLKSIVHSKGMNVKKSSQVNGGLVGAFIVDSLLDVQLIDTVATALLSSNDGMSISESNTLTFDTQERHNKFLELVDKLANASNKAPKSSQMLVMRPSGKLPYLLDVSYSSWSSPSQNTPIYNVWINDLETDVNVPVELLERYHVFTKRECEVAHLLANGNNLQDIANKLDIKVITTRQYLKAMMKKTQTQTRTDLVRLIMLTSFRFSDHF